LTAPIDVHVTISVPVGVVPIAYEYPDIEVVPVPVSTNPLQLAESVLVDVCVSISVLSPSLTIPGTIVLLKFVLGAMNALCLASLPNIGQGALFGLNTPGRSKA